MKPYNKHGTKTVKAETGKVKAECGKGNAETGEGKAKTVEGKAETGEGIIILSLAGVQSVNTCCPPPVHFNPRPLPCACRPLSPNKCWPRRLPAVYFPVLSSMSLSLAWCQCSFASSLLPFVQHITILV